MEEEKSKCCSARPCWNFTFKSCDKCGKRYEPIEEKIDDIKSDMNYELIEEKFFD